MQQYQLPSLDFTVLQFLHGTDYRLDRGQGLNNAITDAADLLEHLRGMKEPTPLELAAAVKRYEAQLFPRGNEAVLASNENTNAVHDWALMMESPLFKGGLAKEGDKIKV
jgi:hypothetical protein